MRKISLLSAFLFIYSIINGQGLNFDSQKYNSSEEFVAPKESGFSSASLPSKISYRKYCPVPNNQGDVSTCVGWSVAYGALSTQLNIQMGVTDNIQKWARAFDPHFVYSFIKDDNDQWCKSGTIIINALNVLEQYGCKPNVWQPWLTCNDNKTFNEFTLALASQYKIESWGIIPSEDIVANTKLALYYKKPVIIGVKLTESFLKGNTLVNGFWKPGSSELNIGGHAMCVVGYDNLKYGGAFEILNSYGSEFGDKGFIWISYNDFKRKVQEAYVMKTINYRKGDCSFGDCYNNYSRFKFENGDIYEGVIKNGLLDVYGSYLYKNGSMYVGGWVNGRKNGWGLFYDASSSKFYSTLYKNDILTEYNEKNSGFAMSDENNAVKNNLDQLSNHLPKSQKPINEFDVVQKVLSKYEAPDQPIFIKKIE